MTRRRSQWRCRAVLLGVVTLIWGAGSAADVAAQTPGPSCFPICGVSCAKPISIFDRWDDYTGIPGYMGESTYHGDWRGNRYWDCESFTDTNGNRLWDPGESFLDRNGNGVHDQELYDPTRTGYVSGPSMPPNLLNENLGDQGLRITLGPPPAGWPFYAVTFPPANEGTPVTGSTAFRENFATCNASVIDPGDELKLEPGNMAGAANQMMRDRIAQDPNAYWDPATRTVQGSTFALSPRVLFLPAHDPRVPIQSGRATVIVSKMVAFFMEEMAGTATVAGYFLLAQAPGGVTCSTEAPPSFLYDCVTATKPTTWGRIKQQYRD